MSYRQSAQSWQRETAATREGDSFIKWYWMAWLILPWVGLCFEEGIGLVILFYVVFGLFGLFLMGLAKLDRHDVKFCPECKAPNPIDANLCQRCGTVPAKQSTRS